MKKMIGSMLALCAIIVLTACGTPRADTSAWVRHSFDGAGIVVALPEDMTWEAADGTLRARNESVRLELSLCGELYEDAEAMAARLGAETGREAARVEDAGGLVRLAGAEDERTAEYYAIGPDGDTYRLLLAANGEEKDRRAAAELSAVEQSLSGDTGPADASTVRHSVKRTEYPTADTLVLVNKRNPLPEGWADGLDLVQTADPLGEPLTVERGVCKAYFALRDALAAEGVTIGLASAYRGDAAQRELAARVTARRGADEAEKRVAAPGCSEHLTALALDLCLFADGRPIDGAEEPARYSEAWEKVASRLAEFGFILRYPEDGTYYTGCAYEPWHIRYVGTEAAREIAARGITLEEYLGKDPASVDYLVLVNAKTALPGGWEDEIELSHMTNRHGEDIAVERVAYEAYCGLRDALAAEGVHLDINSAYRSVAAQEALAKSYTEKYGADYVKRYVAVPGYSEHHTGLAIDLYLESQEVWAKIHAHLAEFGFILRYPEGKESVTGYGYEPWHIRYVGAETAREITARGIALEEYLNAA